MTYITQPNDLLYELSGVMMLKFFRRGAESKFTHKALNLSQVCGAEPANWARWHLLDRSC